jgi:ADP-ribose pyrophosphatase YjhB (NUDIX family)
VTGAPADYCPDCGTATEARESEARERRFCPGCAQFVWQNPVPVGTVVVSDGAEALFVRRSMSPDEGQWDLPGGFIEVDETPAVGVARELEEETRVAVDPDALTLCGVGHEQRGDRYLLPVVYTVDRATTTGEPVAGSDADAVRFARPDDLDPLRDVALSRYQLSRDW